MPSGSMAGERIDPLQREIVESGCFMKNSVITRQPQSSAHRSRRTTVVATLSLLLSLAGLGLGAASATAAPTPQVTSSAPCNATIAAGSGAIIGSYIVGVTAGTTQITFDCDTASSAGILAEASLLAGVGSTAVLLPSEADTAALGTFTASASDTKCPAGTAGSCSTATFLVPASFAASDSQATCPPSQSQINAGLFGCVLAVATSAAQPITEYLMTYASQTTVPTAPTIAATVSAGPPSSTITVSDAAANAGFWWGNGIQLSQAVLLAQSPQAVPASCGTSAGYGNVPSPFLEVNWFAAGSTTAIAGSAAGVTISNDCYSGSALFAPVLGGTIPVPSTLTVGTAYTVYLCELNLTPYPSNDASAVANCGPAAPGTSWIDASFAFTAMAGTPQPALSITTLSGTVGTSLTLATSGGAGTGAVTYVAVDGTASGCAAAGGALSATSAGTCFVTATKASDSADLAVSSIPSVVTFVAMPAPVVKLASTRVALANTAKILPLKLSCTNAPCSGTLNVSARVTVKVRRGATFVKKTETMNFGSASYQITGTSGKVSVHLTASARGFLKTNPARPISASVTVTDNLGKKHTLGRVSLLK